MFRDKKIIVTGGSRGIGFAIAEALARKGALVLITGRNAESLKSAAEKIGANVIPFVWDASKIEETEKKLEEAIALLGGLDALISYVTGVKVTIAKNPLDCVAIGIGHVLESIGDISESVLFRNRGR